MKPLNVVAESLKSLGVDSRAVAQATGISEPNLTAAPSKKCANAPSLGALFAESPDPTTLFERMLKEGTPGFSTDERLSTSLHGLTAALKLAENAEDPQARLAVIVRAVQLAERAGVSKTRQEAAQAFAAWIAGVYMRGIPGGSTKMEVELRVELARAIEQRDEARRQFERAQLSNDCLDEAHKAELQNVSAILGAMEGESLEDAARRAAREREEAQRKCLERLPAVPTEAQILEGIQKLLKSHKGAPIPVLPFDAEVTFVPPKTPAIDHLFKLGATLVTVDADQDGTLLVAGLSDEAMAEAQGVMPMAVRLKKVQDHQLKAMAAAQALCKQDQEPAERIAELDVWLRDAEQRERDLRAHNDGCHAEIARAQSEITRLSEELMAEKKAREAADIKSTMAWATQTEGWAEYQRLRVEVEALVKEAKRVTPSQDSAILATVDRVEQGMKRVGKLRDQIGIILGCKSREGLVETTHRVMETLKGAEAELEKWRDSSAKWLRLQAEVGMVLGRRSGEGLIDAARRIIGERESAHKRVADIRDKLDSASVVIETTARTLGRKMGEGLPDTAERSKRDLSDAHQNIIFLNNAVRGMTDARKEAENRADAAAMLIQDISQKLGRRPDESLADVAQRRMKELSELRGDLRYLDNALGQQDGEDIKRTANRVMAERQEALSRRDTAESALENQHKRIMELGGELDELRARYEDTRKQNEVAGQHLGKQDHEALAHAALRVVQGAEALRQQSESLEAERDELYALRSQVSGEAQKLKETLATVEQNHARVMNRVMTERDSLRTEVTMLRDELKTQKAEREEDKKELAELAIELGQQVGERLITAARRVRETGTHAEVKRLQKVCSHHADRLREKFAEVDAIAKALGDHDGQTDEEAARALVKERDELAAERDTQRAEVRKLQALLALCRNERDRVADALGCPKEGVEESVKAVVDERNSLRGDLATARDERDRALAIHARRYDCHGGLGTIEPACGACVTCLLRVNEQLTAERDGLKQELERCGNAFMQSMKDRSEKANELRADKEAFARDATRVRLALESEVKDLKERLAAVTTQLTIVDKGYDEALELCDRDGMTPAEQIKELRKELEDIRPEAEQMAGWRQSSLNRQVEIQNLQAALAEEKKQRQDFVAALCAELGVEGGERTVMTAVEQLKENHKRLGERVASAPDVASPMPHYDGTVPIGSWVKHGEDHDSTKSGQTAQIIGIDGGMYAVRLANGQVGIWNFARCVPCDPSAAPTSEAKQKKHPEWVRHTKGFNNLKPGTVARVLGVQGDPPDTYKVKRINGPEGSWIIANCEPCEAPSDAGDASPVVQKATTRPADSNCTCHQIAPCTHCTWYADRGMDDPDGTPDSGKPDAADGGLVMAD